MENETIEKIGCVVPILIKNIEGKGKVILQDPGRHHSELNE